MNSIRTVKEIAEELGWLSGNGTDNSNDGSDAEVAMRVDRSATSAPDKLNKRRFIQGSISKLSLSERNRFGKYSLYVLGEFSDNDEYFEGWLSSRFEIKAYRRGEIDPIDPKDIEGERFFGQVYVEQKYMDKCGKVMHFPLAVEYCAYRGEDEAQMDKGNPFSSNPSPM